MWYYVPSEMRTQLPVSLPLGIIPQIISIWGAFLKSDVLFFVFAARKKTAALSVRRPLVLCRIALLAYHCEKDTLIIHIGSVHGTCHSLLVIAEELGKESQADQHHALPSARRWYCGIAHHWSL